MSGARESRSNLPRETRCFSSKLCFALSLLCSLLVGWTARAAPPGDARPRVLLIGKEVDDALMRRLQAELAELDLTVVVRRGSERLDAAAREEGATAAVRVLPKRNGVEVWMADATSGRSLLRQVIVDESPGGPDYNVIALQTAELLRTSLLYKQDESSPPAAAAQGPNPEANPASEAPPTPGAPAAPRSGGQVSIQAGLGALYSPGGASAGLELWVSAHQPLGSWLAVELDLSMPLGRGSLSGPEGSALIGAYSGGVALAARWRGETTPWFASTGLGGGVLRITTEGKAVQPLQSSESGALTGMAYLKGGAGVDVTGFLRVGAGLLVGVAIPPVHVEFAGNRAGTWGAPLLGAFGLVEIPLG